MDWRAGGRAGGWTAPDGWASGGGGGSRPVGHIEQQMAFRLGCAAELKMPKSEMSPRERRRAPARDLAFFA